MKIGVDVDDVLLNTLETAWLPMFNNRTGLNIQATDITEWNITKFIPAEYHKLIYELLNTDELWDMVQPMHLAQLYLEELNNCSFIELYIISATSVLTTKRKWEKFFEYFPFILTEQVILMFNKRLLPQDMIMIDDKIANIKRGDILFTRPHNLDCDEAYSLESSEVIRANDWNEVYENILSRIQLL